MMRGNSGSPAMQTNAATETRPAVRATLWAIAARGVPFENRLLELPSFERHSR